MENVVSLWDRRPGTRAVLDICLLLFVVRGWRATRDSRPGPYSGTPFSEHYGIFRQYSGTFRNIPANITEYSGTMYTQFRLL